MANDESFWLFVGNSDAVILSEDCSGAFATPLAPFIDARPLFRIEVAERTSELRAAMRGDGVLIIDVAAAEALRERHPSEAVRSSFELPGTD